MDTDPKASIVHTVATLRSNPMASGRTPRDLRTATQITPHPPNAQTMSAFHHVSLWSVATAISPNNVAMRADTAAVTATDKRRPHCFHPAPRCAIQRTSAIQAAHPHMR